MIFWVCFCHSLVIPQQLALTHCADGDARARAAGVREARAQRLVEGCEALGLRWILRSRGPAAVRIGRFEFVKILPVFIERSDRGRHDCGGRWCTENAHALEYGGGGATLPRKHS